jgi:predicted secreted protein
MPSVNKRSNISRSILIYIKAPLLSERHLYAVLLSGCQRGVPLPLIKLFLPMVRGLGPAPCVRARLAWAGNDDGRDSGSPSGRCVSCHSCPTTGYRWEARDFDGALVSLEASEVVPSPAAGGAGSAGTSSARAPGHTVIHFVLARPWEKNVHALKQAQVEVTVK